jgi:predicted nucleic acid-binding protein
MAVFFFDSSSIVKRYVQEAGTAWVQAVTDPAAGNTVYLARIAIVEVTSAITRRQRGGSIPTANAAAMLAQFRQDVALEYRIIEVTRPLLDAATLLAEAHALRAYDAVQLAAISELHALRAAAGLPAVTLVSSDQELNAAATALGLPVEDPNLHP